MNCIYEMEIQCEKGKDCTKCEVFERYQNEETITLNDKERMKEAIQFCDKK